MRKKLKYVIGILIVFLLFTAVKESFLTGFVYNKNIYALKQPQLQDYKLIAGNAPKGVYVYGKKLDGQSYFNQVLIKTKTAQKSFNWKATTKNPGLMFADLTGTGEENIILVFITVYGTGLYESKIHVVNMNLTMELPVEDPGLAAQRLISSKIEGNEIVFTAGEREYRVRPAAGTGGIADTYKNLRYGNVVMYSVENNRLKATVTVQTSSETFLGEFTLIYSYSGGKLVPQVAGFEKL